MAKVREEIDRVVGDRVPTYEDIEKMEYTRLVIAETLRMYPEPPLLIRRCRTEDKRLCLSICPFVGTSFMRSLLKG